MSTTVCRSVPFTLARATNDNSQGDDGLTLEGYAAVWDQPTAIDSWEGSFLETIRRGAFRKTIRERTPVMQFEHGRHPLVGSLPIGRLTEVREDEAGLYIRGRLSPNWLVEPVRDAIRDEAVSGMSFRFEVIRDEWRDAAGKLLKAGELEELLWNPGDRGPLLRTLIEVKCQELGPVVFPAYEGTSVGVRAAAAARAITRDRNLSHGVRRALARLRAEAEPEVAAFLPNDPELRAEIARAVLWPETTRDADPDGEARPAAEDTEDTAADPADAEDTSDDGTAEDTAEPDDDGDSTTTDAPPSDGHPSPIDAPPSQGHPSPTADERRHIARRAYVTRERVGRLAK